MARRRAAGSPSHKSDGDDDPEYAMQSFFVYFLNDATEQEYRRFHFIDSGYYAGKGYLLLLIVLTAFVVVVQFQPNYTPTASSVTSWQMIPALVDIGIIAALLGAIMIDVLAPLREPAVLLSALTHWPTLVLSVFGTKHEDSYNYIYVVGCFFFCCTIPMPRFWTMLIVLTLAPICALFAVTFGTDYFSHYSHTEIVLWPFLFGALATLRLFEIRMRRSFAKGRKATQALERIDSQIELTREMVVKYFPRSITAELVKTMGKTREFDLPSTAMVVTDVKGFTAFTATSEASDVIDAVSKMFASFDGAAEVMGVEKVSTVGDSYFGAIFTVGGIRGVPMPTPHAVATVIQFGFRATGFAPAGLSLRVGVHVGNVQGAFIGTAPPKFDLFGAAADHSKRMEQTGEGGLVHVSREAVAAASGLMSAVTKVRPTELGELWGDDEARGDALPHRAALPGDEATLPSLGDVAAESGERHNSRVTESILGLVYLRSDDDFFPTPQNADTQDEGPTTRKLGATKISRGASGFEVFDWSSGDEEDEPELSPRANYSGATPHRMTPPGDDTLFVAHPESPTADADARFDFSYVTLEFKSPSVQQLFLSRYARTGASRQMLVLVTASFAYWFAVCCQFMLCNSLRNRFVMLAIFACVAAMAVHTLLCVHDRATKPRPIVMTVAMNCIVILIFVGGDQHCDLPDGSSRNAARYNLSNLAALAYDMMLVLDQLILDRPLRWRILVSFVEFCIFMGCTGLRLAIYGSEDSVAIWTFTPPIAFVAHLLTGYAQDFTEHASFASLAKLADTLKSAKGAQAAQSEQVLEVMLPPFATSRLFELVNTADADGGDSTTHATLRTGDTSSSTGSSKSMTDLTAILADLRLHWPIDFAVVFFVYVVGEAGESAQHMARAVQRIERELERHGAAKVKSNGNVVLCAAGLGGSGVDMSRSSSMANNLPSREADAVRAVRAATAIGVSLTKQNVPWRIGVHAGSCFGALFGRQGVMFDVFGDTVNTASRFASSALEGTVAISAVVKNLLEAAVARGETSVPVPESSDSMLFFKGLGATSSYTIRPTA